MIQQYRLVGTGGFEEIAYVVGKTVTSSLSQAFPIKSFQGQESFKRESISQFSHSVMSDSLWPHGLLRNRLPCLSPAPGAYSNSCPSSRWCHPTISPSVISFSSHLQSFPASGSFQMSQFTPGGQSIRVAASASILSMNTQDWFPLGWGKGESPTRW